MRRRRAAYGDNVGVEHAVDGMRSVLLGKAHFGMAIDLEVLVAFACVLLVFGAWRFSKIEI